MMGRILSSIKFLWYVLACILTLVLLYFVVQIMFVQIIGVIKTIGFCISNFIPFFIILSKVLGLPIGIACGISFIKFILGGVEIGKRKKET